MSQSELMHQRVAKVGMGAAWCKLIGRSHGESLGASLGDSEVLSAVGIRERQAVSGERSAASGGE